MKPRKAAGGLGVTPRQEPEDDSEDIEAQQAAQLLAEVMLGTPRANAHPMTPRGGGSAAQQRRPSRPRLSRRSLSPVGPRHRSGEPRRWAHPEL